MGTRIVLGLGALLLAGLTWWMLDEAPAPTHPVDTPSGDPLPDAAGLQGRGDTAPETAVDETLRYAIEGQVLDAEGRPVAGARVVAHLAQPRDPSSHRHTPSGARTALESDLTFEARAAGRPVESGPDGRFSMRAALPCLVSAQAPGPRVSGSVRVTEDEMTAGGLVLTLEPAAARTVVVTSPRDLRPTRVMLETLDGRWRYGPHALPADGRLSVDAAPLGMVRVGLEVPSRMRLLQAVAPDAAGLLGVAFPVAGDTRLDVHVVDAKGVALAGAEVHVVLARNPAYAPRMDVWGTTGADGTLGFRDLLAGPLSTIEVRHAKYATKRMQARELGGLEPGETRRLRVVLDDLIPLEGVVQGPGGVPIADAEVRVRNAGPEVRSAADGTFRILGLRGQPVQLTCRAPGYRLRSPTSRGSLSVTLVGSGVYPRVTVAMSPAAALPVRVVEASGAAVRDAVVTAYLPGRFRKTPVGRPARTDATGRCVLDELPGGTALLVRARTAAQESTAIPSLRIAAGARHAEVELVMRDALRIVGHVRTEDDAPVAGRWVRRMGSGGFFGDAVRTDADGRFVMQDLEPGVHTLVLGRERRMGEPSAQEMAIVKLVPGETPDPVLLRSSPRYALSGLVTDPSGTPLSGLSVQVTGKNAGGIHANPGGYYQVGDHGGATFTDEAGHFVVVGLWGGDLEYIVRIQDVPAPGTYRTRTERQTFVAPHTQSRPVTVRLVDAEGTPVPEAHLVFDFDKTARRGWSLPRTATSVGLVIKDGQGTIAWPEHASRARILIAPRTFHALPQQLERDRPEDGELRLTQDAASDTSRVRFVARVTDTEGAPVEGARVELDHFEPTDRFGSDLFFPDRSSLTDERGLVTFPNVPAGAARVRVMGTGPWRRSDPAAVEPGAVSELVAHRAGSVRGRVVDERGLGLAGVEVRQGGIKSYRRPPKTLTDETGHFTLTGLPWGRPVPLVAKPPQDGDQPYFAKKIPSEDVAGDGPLRIELEPGYWVQGRFLRPDGRVVVEGEALLLDTEGKQLDRAFLGDHTLGAAFRLGPVREGTYDVALTGGVIHTLDEFMVRPKRVRVPGPTLEIPVSSVWTVSATFDPAVFTRLTLAGRWCPDRRIYDIGERDGPRMAFHGRSLDADVSNKSGTVRVYRVRESEGTLWVHDAADSNRYALLRYDERDEEERPLVFQEGRTIRGKIEAGKGRRWIRFRQGTLIRDTKSDGDGSFVARGFPPGTWTVQHMIRDFRAGPRVGASVDVEAGTEDVVLR